MNQAVALAMEHAGRAYRSLNPTGEESDLQILRQIWREHDAIFKTRAFRTPRHYLLYAILQLHHIHQLTH